MIPNLVGLGYLAKKQLVFTYKKQFEAIQAQG